MSAERQSEVSDSRESELAAAFIKMSSMPPKAASIDDTIHESAEDARNRRVAELLRRRQPSGLDAGSASPTPPGDSSS